MKKEGYVAARKFFEEHTLFFKIARAVQKGSEILLYLAYPVFLALLFFKDDIFYLKSVAVCGVGFVAVSLFRGLYNAKRPYEIYDIKPLINKNSLGKSFPSRHCFSAAVIAMSFMVISLPLGIVALALAATMAVLRVAFGVHFIKDVLLGLFLGIVVGSIQFFI